MKIKVLGLNIDITKEKKQPKPTEQKQKAQTQQMTKEKEKQFATHSVAATNYAQANINMMREKAEPKDALEEAIDIRLQYLNVDNPELRDFYLEETKYFQGLMGIDFEKTSSQPRPKEDLPINQIDTEVFRQKESAKLEAFKQMLQEKTFNEDEQHLIRDLIISDSHYLFLTHIQRKYPDYKMTIWSDEDERSGRLSYLTENEKILLDRIDAQEDLFEEKYPS